MYATAIKREITRKVLSKESFYWCPYCIAEFTVSKPCYHFLEKDKENNFVYLSLYENKANIEALRRIVEEVNKRGYYRAK